MIAGVTDRAGNAVTPRTTTFTTRLGPDTVAPVLVRTTPTSGSVDVPVNSVLEAEFDEPIDGSALGSVQLFDSFAQVPGTVSVNAGGRIVSFVPNAPLATGRGHSLFLSGMRDLAGNVRNTSFSFTTGTTTDTTPPQVTGVSPGDGFVDVPINAKVTIRFDEPIQSLSIDQITLTGSGGPVDVIRALSDSNRLLTLTPRVPLAANTLHSLNVTGVRDLAGNALVSPVTTSFTTGDEADLPSPTVTTVTPANGAMAVPTTTTVEIHFSEPIDRNSVGSSQFQVLNPSFTPIAGTIVVAADALSAIFTPSSPLAPNSVYRPRASNILDLAGNGITFFQSTFTTAP
jgi:hypothetical protein